MFVQLTIVIQNQYLTKFAAFQVAVYSDYVFELYGFNRHLE